MSGIDEMKIKIKKKMSFDDLPALQEEKENHSNERVAVHTAVHMDEQPHHTYKYSVHSEEQHAEHTTPQNVAQKYSNPVTQNNVNTPLFPPIDSGKISYNRKVTLYLTEELYKAFNDIYARRIIDGRKTDKSALICEAVELLVKEEFKVSSN